MTLQEVVVNWAFIAEPDQEGLYRIQFEINKNSADYAELKSEMEACIFKNGKKKEDITWWSGYKEHESLKDVVCFNAKTNSIFRDKRTGETKKRTLMVYDVNADPYPVPDIPKIQNGAICNVDVNPYFVSFHNKFGVMLGLKTIQLLKFQLYSQAPYNPFKNQSQKYGGEEPTISYHRGNDDDDKIPF